MYTDKLSSLNSVHQQNSSYLQLFEADLQGLAPKTIKHHLQNMDFFLNTYLLFDEAHPLSMQDGVNSIDDFIGYFLEEKTYFADSTKRSFVTSLRKFYKSMAAHGKITSEQHEDVAESLRDSGTVRMSFRWWNHYRFCHLFCLQKALAYAKMKPHK